MVSLVCHLCCRVCHSSAYSLISKFCYWLFFLYYIPVYDQKPMWLIDAVIQLTGAWSLFATNQDFHYIQKNNNQNICRSKMNLSMSKSLHRWRGGSASILTQVVTWLIPAWLSNALLSKSWTAWSQDSKKHIMIKCLFI